MQWTQCFIPTLKEDPIGTEAISHKLLLRGGYVNMLTSGVYSYLPLGLRVLRKIENIIREEMNNAGASELLLPVLHPLDIWQKTGRDETLKEVMISFEDNKGRKMCLGPTHEEIITDLVKQYVQSYKQLPVTLYQIQTKFRDELRTRFGIVRACEFLMKDAYSFDRDKEGLNVSYQNMYEAYQKIFSRLNLDVFISEADSGAMGGDLSHEFLVPAPIGEDFLYRCEECGKLSDTNQNPCGNYENPTYKKVNAVELGHIFQLGTKYTEALSGLFLDDDGKQKPIIMGCYGIGVSRVIAAIIEKYHDENGIIWPQSVAPFLVEIIPMMGNKDIELVEPVLEKLKQQLTENKIDFLIDNRNESAGRKFNDADLIGIPIRITLGKRNLQNGQVEIKLRHEEESFLIDQNLILEKVKELSNV